MNDKLTVLDELPDGLLSATATSLHTRLPGPTLIHLPGESGEPLFTSVLQHGNETAGWEAIRRVLSAYHNRSLPRPWSIFIANVGAAAQGLRRLDHEPDFNRCWPGGPELASPIRTVARQVTDDMRARTPFASVDIHNNTGVNPHYCAINRLTRDNLRLAALFSDTVLYLTSPKGLQSDAFSRFCPAATLECGEVGGRDGIEHAAGFLEHCLALDSLPADPEPEASLTVRELVVNVRVRESVDFDFDNPEATLNFRGDLEELNFRPVPAGTELARLAESAGYGITGHRADGVDVTGEYFRVRDGRLVTRRPVMPAMLTRNRRVIRQDCLCYLMDPVDLPDRLEDNA